MTDLDAEFPGLELLWIDSSGPKKVGRGDAELENKLCPYEVTCKKCEVTLSILFLLSFLMTPSILWVLAREILPPSLPSFLPLPLLSLPPSLSFFFLLFWSSLSQLKMSERSSRVSLVTVTISSTYTQLKPTHTDGDNCLSLSALTGLN